MAANQISRVRIGLLALCGGGAGFLTFLLLEPSLGASEREPARIGLGEAPEAIGRAFASALLLGMVLGALVGVALILADELRSGRAGRAAARGLPGLLIGGLLGAVGGLVGQIVFAMLLVPLALAGAAAMPIVIVARAAGWALVGAAAGICPGVVGKSRQRVRQGLLGGAAGGALGGVLFDVIAQATGTGSASRCIGFTLIGVVVGALVGLVEEAGKRHWLTLLSGSREGRAYILSRPVTVLGRNELADIPLFGDSSVQKAHAALLADGPAVTVRSETAMPLLVNGQPVSSARLSDGDEIGIGRHRLRFHSRSAVGPVASLPLDVGSAGLLPIPSAAGLPIGPGATMAFAAPGSGSLIVIGGPYIGMTFGLFDGAIAGRDPRCDIALTEDTMTSRQHARFVRDGAFWRVEDGGSTNGTYVNGQRITSAVIHPGDQIAIGATLCQLS